ncbi:MAG: cell wall hydrolase [Gemmobacter sp.]
MRFSVVCAFGAAMGLAMSALVMPGPATAEITVSQSNDPTAMIDSQLSQLLGAERVALATLPPDRVRQIVTPRPASPQSPGRIGFDPGWLAAQPAPGGGQQWHCLTQALYFEARGEAIQGQVAVAEVILNRVDAPNYPDTVCEVVHQGTGRLHACQFSFTCDGKPEVIREATAYEHAGKIARLMLDGAPRTLTRGATHFHTRAVRPAWSRSFPRTAAIGAHLFYRQPGTRSAGSES